MLRQLLPDENVLDMVDFHLKLFAIAAQNKQNHWHLSKELKKLFIFTRKPFTDEQLERLEQSGMWRRVLATQVAIHYPINHGNGLFHNGLFYDNKYW